MLTDALGLPLSLLLSGGQESEITYAERLISKYHSQYLLADRGYDSDAFRAILKKKNVIPVIPGRKNRLRSIDYDKHIYKERNIIERCFGRLKEFRRVATRYDKTAVMLHGTLLVATIFS